jgi:hypothetical protein
MRQRDSCGARSEEGLLDEEELSQGMRWLKRTDTPILKGMQIFHNYITPHEGLDGMHSKFESSQTH